MRRIGQSLSSQGYLHPLCLRAYSTFALQRERPAFAMRRDEGMDRPQLIEELESLRQRVADLESSQPDRAGKREESVNRLSQDLDFVYREAPIGLCQFDLDLRFVQVNRWLAAINGLSIEKHLGRTIGEVLPDVATGVESQHRQVIATGRPVLEGLVTAETSAHPGEKMHYQHNFYPVKSDDGTVVGVSCAVQDVTRRALAEAALQTAKDELGGRVRERTKELEEVNASLKSEIEEHRRTEEELLRVRRLVTIAQEGERRLIARELHDDVTQRMAGLAIALGVIEREKDPIGASGSGEICKVREAIEQLSFDVHELGRKLHPSIVEDLGLIRAIQSQCEQLKARGAFEFHFVHENLPKAIPVELSLSLYRIAQEALRNAQKYSQSKRVDLGLRISDGQLHLSVKDHGVGFRLDNARRSAGIGLTTMEERAKLSGGQFSVQSSPGKGTTIQVLIPWQGGTQN